jgi:uncharacterized protein
MKEVLRPFGLVLLVSVILLGLTNPSGAAPATTDASASWPKIMTITCPAAGSSMAVYSTGVAKIIENYLKIPTAPQACSGSMEAAMVMVKGSAQFAGCSGAEVIYATLDKAPFPKGTSDIMRGLFFGAYMAENTFTVRADSGINSIKDLKGKRVMCYRPGQAMYEDNWRATLEAYGMTEKDIIVMPALDIANAAQALKEGRTDAAFHTSMTPAPGYLETDNSHPLKVLPLTDEAIQHVMKKCAWTGPYLVHKGAFKGQATDAKIITTHSGIAVRKDLPDDLVYAICKAVDEHISEIQAIHPGFKNWTMKEMANSPYGIYHAGALKYFQDKNLLDKESLDIHKDYLTKAGRDK